MGAKVPGLSLGGIGAPTHFTMQQPDMTAPKQAGVPGLSLGNKIPPLGGGGALPQMGDTENSGRLSSKRDGVGRLNLGKAIGIQ